MSMAEIEALGHQFSGIDYAAVGGSNPAAVEMGRGLLGEIAELHNGQMAALDAGRDVIGFHTAGLAQQRGSGGMELS